MAKGVLTAEFEFIGPNGFYGIMLAIMRDRDESQDRLQQIAERLSGLGDNISYWADEDYVSEPGDDGDRFTVKYLVSTDKGKAPEPDVVAAEISTRAIASFIAKRST